MTAACFAISLRWSPRRTKSLSLLTGGAGSPRALRSFANGNLKSAPCGFLSTSGMRSGTRSGLESSPSTSPPTPPALLGTFRLLRRWPDTSLTLGTAPTEEHGTLPAVFPPSNVGCSGKPLEAAGNFLVRRSTIALFCLELNQLWNDLDAGLSSVSDRIALLRAVD